MHKIRFQTFLAFVPILTAGLCYMGKAYHMGYLEAFGIEDSLFPLSIDRLLFSGFIALANFAPLPLLYIVCAMAVLILMIIGGDALLSSSRIQRYKERFVRWIKSFQSEEKPSKSIDKLVDKAFFAAAIFMGILLTLGFVLILAMPSAKAGHEQAYREMKIFSAGKSADLTVSADTFPSPTKAKQVICGTTHCAFWLGKETIILRHDQVKKIVTCNSSQKDTCAR